MLDMDETFHVSSACVRTSYQMKFTLKGYAFSCLHTSIPQV